MARKAKRVKQEGWIVYTLKGGKRIVEKTFGYVSYGGKGNYNLAEVEEFKRAHGVR